MRRPDPHRTGQRRRLAREQDNSTEIIVRANRRAQSAIDVPVQVSSLDSEALKSSGVTTLEDIGDRIPNTYFGSNSGYGTPAFSIRGVGGTLSTGGEEPVAIFFDDQFIPRTFPSGLLDVESVEVLRSARPDLNEVTGYARAQYAQLRHRGIGGRCLRATFRRVRGARGRSLRP